MLGSGEGLNRIFEGNYCPAGRTELCNVLLNVYNRAPSFVNWNLSLLLRNQTLWAIFIGPRYILWGNWYPLFQFGMTLPMGFKSRVDSSSPVRFCPLCTMIPRTISGCQGWMSNPDSSPVRQEQYYSTMPLRLSVTKITPCILRDTITKIKFSL